MEAQIQSQQQEDTFSIVERVARIVSNVRGTKPDYAHLAAELAPAFPFDLFGVVLLRYDRQAVRVTVCTREAEGWSSHYHQHPFSDSMLERILQGNTPPSAPASTVEADSDELPALPVPSAADALREIIVKTYPGGLDGSPAECGDALSGHPQLRVALIAPLRVGERVLGTLELGSVDIRAYDDERGLRVIQAVVQVLAAAIESAQVGGNVEIQDRQRQELQKVSSALASTMDLPTILRRIVDGIAKALNVASAIVTVERSGGKLRLDAQHGMNTELLRAIMNRTQTLSESSIIGATLRRRQPLVSNDIAKDAYFQSSYELFSELGMRSVFCYPLAAGSTVFGALLLLSPEPGGFTPLKADILSLFASQATIAIHHGMLLESARQRRRFQDAISQLEKAHQQMPTQGEELRLLKKVREETERSFSISFSSLLRFISDHLLTRSEGDLQAILRAFDGRKDHAPAAPGMAERSPGEGVQQLEMELFSRASHQERLPAPEQAPTSEERDADVFARSAEAALARAGLLGDVGAALTAALDPGYMLARGSASAIPRLYEQVTRDMQDPWFIVDLRGQCIYVNPAAEALCGIRLDFDAIGNLSMPSRFFDPGNEADSPQATLRLQETLAGLLPRTRNYNEVMAYLQEFERPDLADRYEETWPLKLIAEGNSAVGQAADLINLTHVTHVPRLNPLPTQTLRCVIAADDVHPARVGRVGEESSPFTRTLSMSDRRDARRAQARSMALDNAPSDRHYQFMRYALYDQHNELIAHALQIHDITEQVRDERNKSALLSSVSHDLRTPLTAIKAAVSGLLQPGVKWNEKVRHEMLVDIDSEADHLHRLINAMVEMSRIEMGALTLEREWCDLVEIAHSAASQIHRAMGDYHIQTSIEPQLPLAFVDYLQMKRVFTNLLENAARHSPEGGTMLITAHTVSLDATAHTAFEGMPRYVRVSVVDQGKGVPEEERERIFKSFYSLDGHTGLGLAICRGIVEAHQGRIWVESAPDGGACFVFVLPVSV
jgi:signal transduction histidine kinase/GAF domain-containing protein